MNAPALASVTQISAPSSHASASNTVDDAVPAYVRRAQAGDAQGFKELYSKHKRDVARLAMRMVGPRADLEDVVQEVFVQVFRSLSAFRGESRFSTWLHRVTVNVSLMYLRAQKSRPQLARDSVVPEPATSDIESPASGAATAERLRALYAILDNLSDKKRVVFVLHDLEGVSASEIADTVGAPVLTVRTRLFYARREVYAAMAKDPSLDAIAKELGLEQIR
ncbi:MAG: sigma-70 family RNA polymerase sigma factor [Myxococcales bacterium]|nr:sigma-70 family RNA polymerase sigma factor [Myxococcales bacterium]